MYSDAVYNSGDRYSQNLEDIYAALLVVIPCFIGLIMALTAIYGCGKIRSMSSPFGYLTKYQLIAQTTACLNSMSFYLFGVLFDIKTVIYNSQIFGLFSLCLVPIILSLYLSISLNRLIALIAPLNYVHIFDLNLRRAYVFSCWVVPIIYTVFLCFYYNCGYKFYHYGWIFSFVLNDTCGDKMAILLHATKGTLVYLIFFFDIITMILLVFFRKRVLKVNSEYIQKRESMFAKQVIIQGFVFMAFSVGYTYGYKLVPAISEKWKIFWTTSFPANMLHIFDTMVLFVFNAEFTIWIRKLTKRRTASISRVTTY